jgi:hypothetical protein
MGIYCGWKKNRKTFMKRRDFLTSAALLSLGSNVVASPLTLIPSTKIWYPGHYLMVTDDVRRTGMMESRRNLVRTNPNWQGYYGHYFWHRIETAKDVYDFSIVLKDLDKAELDGKKMYVMMNNRSFHGDNLGAFVPEYIITELNGTYSYNGQGFQFRGPKLWEPEIGDRWLIFVEKFCREIKDHPALAAIATEECTMSGSWLQPSWSIQKINSFLLRQSKVGSENCGNVLFHNNMSWAAEGINIEENKRMLDTMIFDHKTGVCPNDLAVSTYLNPLANPYGKAIFTDTYKRKTFHIIQVEWGSYFLPERPSILIDYAKNLGIQYIGWQAVTGPYNKQQFNIYDVIREIDLRGNDLPNQFPSWNR